MISLVPEAYDADDTDEQYFIIGKPGVAIAPAITINISNVNPTAKTGDPQYKATGYSSTYLLSPASYLAYIKGRKDHKVITSLNEITKSGTYIYEGDITINSNTAPFNQPYNLVLIAAGTVTINPSPTQTFAPVGSVAIVASTINFDSSITEAQGIFVAKNIGTGTNTNQGLKIIGNLIAQTALTNGREWPTTARPSVFIKFDQTKYINLLSYLSTVNYDWRQIQ